MLHITAYTHISTVAVGEALPQLHMLHGWVRAPLNLKWVGWVQLRYVAGQAVNAMTLAARLALRSQAATAGTRPFLKRPPLHSGCATTLSASSVAVPGDRVPQCDHLHCLGTEVRVPGHASIYKKGINPAVRVDE
jgi:hypothetical protein